jgi:triosephosphate isomerase (TIM)
VKKPLIIANWKMSLAPDREMRMFDVIVGSHINSRGTVVVCPSFLSINQLAKKKSSLAVGAQDCFWQTDGPYTGEISPKYLRSIGCKLVIVGHSERREHLHEDEKSIIQKVHAVLSCGMHALLCVGETTSAQWKKELSLQLAGTSSLPSPLLRRLLIGYEPRWAIGSGRALDPSDCAVRASYIRESFHSRLSVKVPVLYGGSVSAANANTFLGEGLFDGLLIGSASLTSSSFLSVLKSIL